MAINDPFSITNGLNNVMGPVLGRSNQSSASAPAPPPPPAPAKAASGGGGKKTTTPAQPAAAPAAAAAPAGDIKEMLRTQYPAFAWAIDEPQIGPLLIKAQQEGWSAQKLLANLVVTPWWQAHGSSMRDWLQLQTTDPETLNEKIRAKDADVNTLQSQLGASLDAGSVDHLARQAIQLGWNDSELREAIASQIKWDTVNPHSGNIGTIDNSMMYFRQQAAEYGVSIPDQTQFDWSREVAAGHKQAADYLPVFQDWAKSKFPTIAPYIDNGVTPKQFFSQHIQSAATILELSPDQVSQDFFNDPKFAKVSSYADPKTGQPRAMTVSESQAYYRSLDQWKSTRNGQKSAADFSEGLLNMFGKVNDGSTPALSAA